jgi:hypothetical protein
MNLKSLLSMKHEKVPVAQLVERVLWILSYDGNVRQYLLSTFNGEVGSSSLPWCIIFFFESALMIAGEKEGGEAAMG